MNANSLRIFSQIRLYSAIYPRRNIADITETTASIWPIEWGQFPIFSQTDIPIKRLPGVNPLRYQSAVGLMLSARLGQSFETIVQIICERGRSEVPRLSGGKGGWITLTWDTGSLYETLDRIFVDDLSMPLNPLIPFCLWQTHARCRSLRSAYSEYNVPDLKSKDPDQPMPESAQPLFEAIIHLLDRLDDPLRPLRGKALQREIHQICQYFDQVHGQMPIFNPHLSESDGYLFYRLLGWLQALLARCSPIEMQS